MISIVIRTKTSRLGIVELLQRELGASGDQTLYEVRTMERALQHLVIGMLPVSGVTFAIMVPLLTFAALLASFIPARRASTVHPIKALRQE